MYVSRRYVSLNICFFRAGKNMVINLMVMPKKRVLFPVRQTIMGVELQALEPDSLGSHPSSATC